MRKYLLVFVFFTMQFSYGQAVRDKLSLAVKELEADSQLRHALIGFCVVDGKTGKLVYEHNAQIGLAPASTQKLFTSCAAFDLLGKDYRFKTEMGYTGSILKDSLNGFIYFKGNGDPSFGSSRYAPTAPDKVFHALTDALRIAGIKKMADVFYLDDAGFDKAAIPDGWIWQDIGNYYGAGAWSVNWKENQYDVVLTSGDKLGKQVVMNAGTTNAISHNRFINTISSAETGSGDNAYIYFPFDDTLFMLRGTIPVNEKHFSISGASTSGPGYFVNDFRQVLHKEGILQTVDRRRDVMTQHIEAGNIIYSYYSPPLDSIVYWFLKKSINLYGEALIKTIAYEKAGFGSTEKGVELVKNFWQEKGIERSAVNIIDGSGLSPQNRVTADALVKVLQYAKNRPWFSAFFNALPEFNGMKMKSGSISGARAYAGYQVSKAGTAYSFAIIVNNYNGDAGSVIKKMYQLLDNLK
jgi:serine-type D-Ala-D-Ala carboxypeptidase/endopeptidase (penicillin-binding protein 4)